MLRVVLVDDEPSALRGLQRILQSMQGLEIVGVFGNGRTAVAGIHCLRPDVVFLDIEMPEMSGFDVLGQTREHAYQLVFTTAYDQYALPAFETRAIDYLLKPIRASKVERAIEKIRFQQALATDSTGIFCSATRIRVWDGHTDRHLLPSDVMYIDVVGRYRCLHLSHRAALEYEVKTILTDDTLDSFESKLYRFGFFRIHRGYLVAIDKIKAIELDARRYYVSLIGGSGTRLPVGRRQVSALKTLINAYYGSGHS